MTKSNNHNIAQFTGHDPKHDDQNEACMVNGQPLTPEDLARLTELNEIYAQVVIGGKHRILSQKPCPVLGQRTTYESPKEFNRYFENQPKVAGLNLGDAWLKWPDKNMYKNGIGYYPDTAKLPEHVFNTFKGFGCVPLEGDIELILEFIIEGLCNGDHAAATFTLCWLAHMVQYPAEKPTIAILLKSLEGTGKGTFFRLLNLVLGTNAYQVNGHKQLTGRFNSVNAEKLLIFADEVDLSKPSVFDSLKSIISERYISIEMKGLEPTPSQNLARYIFASNHDKILCAGTRERRFLVLEPSNAQINNRLYWQTLNQAINAGASAFLFYLQSMDLSKFDPYKAPVTQGLIDEKLSSLKPILSFIFEELLLDKPFSDQSRIFATAWTIKFEEWSAQYGKKITRASARSTFGKVMNNLGIKPTKHNKTVFYELPPIPELQQRFATLLGHDREDIFKM